MTMTLRKQCLAVFVVFGVIAMTAPATRAQFITMAPGGPSGFATATVYGPPYGLPPLVGPGPTVFLVPPPPPNPPAPPGAYIVDALSSAAEAGNAYLFSVAPGAVGAPGSPVAFQAGVGTAPSQFFPGPPVGPLPPETAGDIFVSSVNFGTGLPHPTFGVPALAAAIPPATLIGADEFALGLNCGPPVGANDNVNGLMLRIPAGGFGAMYYSLAAAGLGFGPFGPADIISPPAPAGLWAPAAALGLVPGDDIDALIIQDLSPAPVYTPGVDFVAFSLAPGSPTLGLIGAGPGDVLLAVPAGLPVIFISAAALGLAPVDNLDALDVIFIDRCSNTNAPTPPTKWIELPDLTTNGLTVRASAPKILADDFRCTLTGPITDIHLWGAWLSNSVTAITNFHISFHEDIPVSITNLYSRPGAELWSTNFSVGQYVVTSYTNAPEPFYDPNVNAIIGSDSFVFRYDFWIEPCRAFVQTNGGIYWMDVQAYLLNTNRVWGWKSSTEHCYDDAVWGDTPMPVWNELRYPTGPLTNQSFDLAFELTTQVPFSQWQVQYFGSVTNTDAAGMADPDGDGMSNTNEYLSGTVPTNAASAFRIVSIDRQSGTNINLAWTTVGCHTYLVQTNRPVTIGSIAGNFTNDWADLSSGITVPGSSESTNFLTHFGAVLNNSTALYYRVRLLCP